MIDCRGHTNDSILSFGEALRSFARARLPVPLIDATVLWRSPFKSKGSIRAIRTPNLNLERQSVSGLQTV